MSWEIKTSLDKSLSVDRTIINILPLDDLYEHIATEMCECNPRVETINNSLLIIHNSYDLREIVEEASLILRGKE